MAEWCPIYSSENKKLANMSMRGEADEVVCYYQNVRGMRSKTLDFYNSVASCEFDFIGVSETWLQPDIVDSELFPQSYTVYRADRQCDILNTSRGGGVLLSVTNKFVSEKLNLSLITESVPFIDIVGCKITIHYTTLCIFVLYIPPSLDTEQMELFFELFSALDCVQSERVLIMGDFNVPTYNRDVPSGSRHRILNEFVEILNCRQYNNIPNAYGRYLDLVFANFDAAVLASDIPLVAEDLYHPSLLINFHTCHTRVNMIPSNNDYAELNFNFRRANFPLMYDLILNEDWSPVTDCQSLEDACRILYDTLNNIFVASVPQKSQRRRHFPLWYTKEIIDNIYKKESAYRNFKLFKQNFYYQKFTSLRRLIKQQSSVAYREYIRSTENNISNDPSSFWAFIHSKRSRSGIPNNMRDNDRVYSDPPSIVTAFGNYFHSVFIESSRPEEHGYWEASHLFIDVPEISEKDIVVAARSLKNKLTSGPDGIPSFIVKDCVSALSGPLLHIFNLVLTTHTFPAVWKVAKVRPILKSGDPGVIDNYRPISILCNFSKILEIILHKFIFSKVRNTLSVDQHGFMPGRSTTTNLASFSQFVCDGINDGSQIDVVYTDFRKAFDRLDHYLLLDKVGSRFGLSNNLISLLNSYLLDRRFFVEINGFRSPFHIPTSGVPQGSNMGPLLFNMFVDDLLSEIDCRRLAYADDLKIFKRIDSVSDCHELQSSINALTSWCSTNRLTLNVSKCNVVRYSYRNNPIFFNYSVDDIVLQNLRSVRDLGIIFDEKFSFADHIEQMVAGASRMLGFLIRNCRDFTNISAIKLLYYSFVRSKFDYASIVWYPIYNCHSNSIESIQRRFIKYLIFKVDGIYPDRGADHNQILSRFNELPLAKRRDIHSIKFLYKLLNHHIDCPFLLSTVSFHVPRLGARHSPIFSLGLARSNILFHSPTYIMCKNGNVIGDSCDFHFSRLSVLVGSLLSV